MLLFFVSFRLVLLLFLSLSLSLVLQNAMRAYRGRLLLARPLDRFAIYFI